MALSTRAKIAGLGGALALGVLGATGIAYAADSGTGTPQYVTTVDEGGGSGAGTAEQAPADQGPRGGGKDCPEGSGGSSGSGSGSGEQGDQGGSGSPAPSAPSESAPGNPADT